MTDIVDLASDLEQRIREQALMQQRLRAANQLDAQACATVCQARGCAQPIPAERRQLLPGVRYCTACQARLERTYK